MNILSKCLYNIRLLLFYEFRENKLSEIIFKEIKDILGLNLEQNITILDFGSGKQPIIIQKLIFDLNKFYKKNLFKAECFDFYTKTEIDKLNKTSNQIQFYDLKKLRYKKKYDFILVIDVLHHIGVEKKSKIISVLNLMKSHCKYLFIKDHFEYGFFSNKMLRIMDFVGNYYNGVTLPKKYFTQIEYDKLIDNIKLKEIKRISNIRYYKKYWLFFSNPKLQFISVLKDKNLLG
jgi:hypothetical protein|tara:strand:- start:206 stop:904 length:699 start_codon:yes stop_codon:yes gene_type:complete